MPSQEQIDQEARGSEIEQRISTLEFIIATLRRNGLEPLLMQAGVIPLVQSASSNNAASSQYGLLYYGSGKYGGT